MPFSWARQAIAESKQPRARGRGILFLGLIVKSAFVGAVDNNTSQWRGEVGGGL